MSNQNASQTIKKAIAEFMLIVVAIALLVNLSGCTVVSVAIGATSAVVGGAIDVVDIVTPDIIDDDDDDDEVENENKDNLN